MKPLAEANTYNRSSQTCRAMRTLVVAIILDAALFVLVSCSTPTKVGLSADVPFFGHLEFSADPAKAVGAEATRMTNAVGLTTPAAPAAGK